MLKGIARVTGIPIFTSAIFTSLSQIKSSTGVEDAGIPQSGTGSGATCRRVVALDGYVWMPRFRFGSLNSGSTCFGFLVRRVSTKEGEYFG